MVYKYYFTNSNPEVVEAAKGLLALCLSHGIHLIIYSSPTCSYKTSSIMTNMERQQYRSGDTRKDVVLDDIDNA